MKADWEKLSDAELLDVPLRQLDLRIEGTWIEDCLAELYRELEERDLRFRPHAWLSYDWFVPDGVAGIAIPFFLAHPRLMRLERKHMLDVEGGTRHEMMKILRHECGHAIDNAFDLERAPGRLELFGNPSKRYPKHYRPNPASRQYVHHLRLYYAQSHPVEDFAETFAIILASTPGKWRKRYAEWPALKKLEFVENLLENIRGRKPAHLNKQRPDSIGTLKMTLRQYYTEKRQLYEVSYPDIYDRDLKRLFSADPRHRRRELASAFIRRNRSEIRSLVSQWTGEYEFTLQQVLDDMIGRCRELKLRAAAPERKLKMAFAILLTVKTVDFHYGRRNWFAL